MAVQEQAGAGAPISTAELRALVEEAKALVAFLRAAHEGRAEGLVAPEGTGAAIIDFIRAAASIREVKFARTSIALADEEKGLKEIEAPALAHPKEDIGFDLRTAIDFTIHPGEMKEVPTGLIFDLPVNEGLFRVELKIEQRTGNGGKGLFAAAKTIDAGYRPDPEDPNGLVLRVRNVGNDVLEFKRGDAVAQGIFAVKAAPTLREVGLEDINYNTARGPKRFGDTGR